MFDLSLTTTFSQEKEKTGSQRFTDLVKKSIAPVKNFGLDVKQGFLDAKDSMKETSDSKDLDESERADYMDQLSEIHNVNPVGTFAIFNTKEFTNAPITTNKEQLEDQFRRPYSVFEEYNGTQDEEHANK
jgi:hypothetical protein